MRPLLAVTLSILITACGGSGGSNESGSITSNFGDVSFQSYDTLTDKAIELSDKAYSGNESLANLTDDNALNFIGIFLFESGILPSPNNTILTTLKTDQNIVFNSPLTSKNLSIQKTNSAQPAAFSVDDTSGCDNGGTRRIAGQLNDDGIGALGVVFNNCQLGNSIYNGKGAFYYHDSFFNRITSFFDSMNITTGNSQFILTGFITPDGNSDFGNLTVESKTNKYSYKLKDFSLYEDNYSFSTSGAIFIPEYGYVSLSSENVYKYFFSQDYYDSGKILFSGANNDTLELKFVDNNFEIRLDNQGDQVIDYIAVESQYNELTNKLDFVGNLIAFEDFSYPPTYSEFAFVDTTDINTTTPIEVSISGVSDPEQDAVTVEYQWQINSVKITDQKTNTLPALIAKKGETVSVRAVLDDGTSQISTETLSLVIGDAPSSIVISDLPETIIPETEISFTAAFVDPDPKDIEASNFQIISAPEGVSLADGIVTWDVEKPIMPGTTYFITFSATIDGNEVIETTEFIVDDPNGNLPIARSGIEVPYNNYSTWVGQFDEDSKNEILLTDSQNRVMTLEYDNDTYIQDWMYPYNLDSAFDIVQVLKVDIDQNGIDEIIAATSDKVFLISDRKSIAKTLFDAGENVLVSIIAADTNEDSIEELAILLDNRLVLLDITDSSEVMSIYLSTPSTESVLIGNVDNDNAKEIVLSSGYVYDATSGLNEWFYPSGFGDHISLADVDGNGVQEIFGSTYWGAPSLFDAAGKELLWSFDNFNTCSVLGANIDTDAGDELLVGDCQWGNITAYDATTTDYNLKWSVDKGGHGSSSLAVGDANNDSNDNLIWSSGITSTGEDQLSIAILEGAEIQVWQNTNPSQLDSFVAAGIAEVTPDRFKAIYVVPETDSGYDGHRIIQMDFNGSYSISDETNTNWNGSKLAETTDFDNDGHSELFYTSADLYDDELTVVKLDDFSNIWTTGKGNLERQVNTINVTDINQDGFDDLIYSHNQQINIVNLSDQTLIDVFSVENNINDIAVEALNESEQDIIIATTDQLVLFSQNNLGAYQQSRSIAQQCSQVEIQDIDGITGSEIICLESSPYYYTEDNSIIYIYDNALNLKTVIDVNGHSTGFTVENSESLKKNVLVATTEFSDSYWYDDNNINFMQLMSASSAQKIWRSPRLLNSISKNSLYYFTDDTGKQQLTFATDDAMYLTK